MVCTELYFLIVLHMMLPIQGTALIRHRYGFAVILSVEARLLDAVRSYRFVAAALYGVSFARDVFFSINLTGIFPSNS